MSVSIPVDIPIWKMKKEVGEENSVDTATLLTGFVREKYLKHIKALLCKNYAACSMKRDSLRVITDHDIDRCAKELESEALRNCMVVQLYQKSISYMVKDIKTHTNLLKLHSIFEQFPPSTNNKEVQTDSVETDNRLSNPLPDLIGTFKKSNTVRHRSTSESTHGLRTIKEEPTDNIDIDTSIVKQEKCDSDNMSSVCAPHPDTKVSTMQTNLQRQAVSQTQPCVVPKKDPEASNEQNMSADSESSVNDLTYPSLDERLAELLGEDNSTGMESNFELDEHLCQSSSDVKDLDFPYLDERLAEIFGETIEQEPEVKKTRFIKKVTSWTSEKETNIRMLNSLMTRFSKVKKQKMHLLFYELFEHRRKRIKAAQEIEGIPSLTGLALEKKRLGRRVVHHLMHYYKSGKISSREQFKSTASFITDGLMLKTSSPDETEVLESITAFFTKSHSFMI